MARKLIILALKSLVFFLGIVVIGWLLYQDAWVREQVVSSAGKLGTQSVPFLCHAFADENPKVRQAASVALRDIGENALPTVRESLIGTNAQGRKRATDILAVLGPK